MLSFIKKFFTKKSSQEDFGFSIVSDDAEVNALFWKLLHDDSLSMEQQAELGIRVQELFEQSMIKNGQYQYEIRMSPEQKELLKKLYREGVILLHPDKNIGRFDQEKVKLEFNRFNEAYIQQDLPLLRILLNDAKRKR